MSLIFRILLAMGSIIFCTGIIYLVIKGKMSEHHSLIWLAFGILFLVIAICPFLLTWVVPVITIPIFLLVLMAIIFLILIMVYYCMIISSFYHRINQLTQHLALIQNQLNSLRKSQANIAISSVTSPEASEPKECN